MTEFKDVLSLSALRKYVKSEGFKQPTDVQAQAIPRLLAGKSLSVLAQTGSGKTLAYALPVVQMLKKLEKKKDYEEPPARTPTAWIICPTHELGAQVEQVFKSIAHQAKLRVRLVKKGNTQKQTRSSMSGVIDVLIGSPNRILEAIKSGGLKPDGARYLIFDEADQLFDASFLPDVKALVSRLQSPELQIGLFSATRPATFADIRRDTFPGVKFEELELQGSHTLKDNIATTNYTIPFKYKAENAAELLKTLRGPGFIFVNLKRTAEALFNALSNSLPQKRIFLLHGGMENKDRRKALTQFEESGDYLICTDIAARGIDIPTLSWVLNYDLPFEPVYYSHRCGRVGRRGQPADVINFVTTKDFPLIERINTAIENQSSLKLARVVGKKTASSKGKKTSKGKPTRGKSAKGKPTRGKAPAGKPTKGKSPAGKPTRGKPAKGKPAAGKPARGKPAKGKPAAGKPTKGRPTKKKSRSSKPPRGRPGMGRR